MKPAYYQNQHGGRDRWMVSYLDVLTILLILFVAMAAQTLQSAQKKPAVKSRGRPHSGRSDQQRRLRGVPRPQRQQLYPGPKQGPVHARSLTSGGRGLC